MRADEAILRSIRDQLTYLEFNERRCVLYYPKTISKHIKCEASEVFISNEYIHIWVSNNSVTNESRISLFETKNIMKDIDDFIRAHIEIKTPSVFPPI